MTSWRRAADGPARWLWHLWLWPRPWLRHKSLILAAFRASRPSRPGPSGRAVSRCPGNSRRQRGDARVGGSGANYPTGFLPPTGRAGNYPGNCRVLWVNYPEIAKRPAARDQVPAKKLSLPLYFPVFSLLTTSMAILAFRTGRRASTPPGGYVGAAPGGDLTDDPTDGCFTGVLPRNLSRGIYPGVLGNYPGNLHPRPSGLIGWCCQWARVSV